MAIEQIYCTHCTYGTSALEQREGELADRVLGYSARAGSLDRNELRNDYRAIERFLYYYLPSDTPPEDKQRLDAAAAPRRLFFCPAMGKLQMVGQVAYRQYDTAGRLGSYFAHVLFGDHVQGRWSAADCLRLWHAPWVEEDTADHPYKLPALESLDQLWAGKIPLVSDDAVLSFLQGTPGSVGRASSLSKPDGLGRSADIETVLPGGSRLPLASSDGLVRPPDALVDARWQAVPQQQGIDLLVNTLQGLLNLGPQRRENILLVVEPGLAALVFYGVARLLPKSLSAGLSFSTYEPNAERLPVTLAATTFFDPYNNDVRPELYRRRGLVINTFQDRMSEAGAPAGDYARFIVDRLLEEGWPTVDRLISAFDEAGARRPEDVELLARTHRVSIQVLSAAPPEDDGWRKSEVAVRYLQREVQHQLVNAPAGWPQLHKVIGTPNHLTVLELVAGEGMPAELQRPAQFLLKKFPPERIADLVNSPLVAQTAKLEALVAFVAAQNRLPEGCQLLPTDGGRLKPRPASEALLGELLVRLPEPVLWRLGDSIADAEQMAWFGALVDVSDGRSPGSPLKKMVVETIARFSDAELLDALVRYREPVMRACPPPEPVLARRLGRLLYELPKHPESFEKRLSVLLEWKASFTHPNLAEQRLGEWNKFRSCLLALREPGEAAAAGKMGIRNRLRSPPRAEYKPLAEALNHAMPRRPYEFQELHDVAARCVLNLPQFKERLTLAARHAGLSITFDDQTTEAHSAGDDLFFGPGDEVGRLHQQREQQHRMLAMFHGLEERLLIYADDGLGSEKLRVMQQVGQVLAGRSDFLGQGRQMVEAYFSNGGAWSGPVLLSGGTKKHGRTYGTNHGNWKRQFPKMLGIVAGVALLMLVIGHYFLSPNSRSKEKEIASQPSSPAVSASGSSSSSANKGSQLAKPLKPPSEKPKPPGEPPKRSADAPKPRTAPSTENQTSTPRADDGPADTPASANDQKASTEKIADNDSLSMPAVSSGSLPDVPDKKPAPPLKPVGGESADTPSKPKPEPDDPPPPSTSKTQSASDAVKSGSPVIVRDYCSLPLPGRTFASPVVLKKWTADPGPITLSLKGLTAANKRLSGPLRLATKEQGSELSIVLEEAAGDGPGNTLAMLTTHNNELSFRWAETAQIRESSAEARLELRRCVVEVASDSETSYISLMSPVPREELGWKNGTAKLGLQELHNSEFQFRPDDELRLGRGAVRFSDMLPLTFGDKQHAAASAALHDLPEFAHDSRAQVVLWRNDKNPLDCALRLVSDTTALPEGMSPVSKEDRDALETLKKTVPKLRNLTQVGQPNPKQLMTMDLYVRTLAEILSIANPPLRAGAAPPANPMKYAAEVKKRIIDPAEARRDQLAPRVRAMDDFFKTQQAQLKVLVTRAVTITATIYRRVEADLYAPCLVLGDPTTIPDELPPGFGYEVDRQE